MCAPMSLTDICTFTSPNASKATPKYFAAGGSPIGHLGFLVVEGVSEEDMALKIDCSLLQSGKTIIISLTSRRATWIYMDLRAQLQHLFDIIEEFEHIGPVELETITSSVPAAAKGKTNTTTPASSTKAECEGKLQPNDTGEGLLAPLPRASL